MVRVRALTLESDKAKARFVCPCAGNRLVLMKLFHSNTPTMLFDMKLSTSVRPRDGHDPWPHLPSNPSFSLIEVPTDRDIVVTY